MEAWGLRSLKVRPVHIATGLGVAVALAFPGSAPAAFKPIAEFGAPQNGELLAPLDVDRDGGGNTYVLNAIVPAVQKYDPTGAPVLRWGTLGTGPGELQNPTALAVNRSTGDVYVAEFSETDLQIRIQRFDADGTFLGQWGSTGPAEGQFSPFVLGIAVNRATGDVYTAERTRVQRFSADGQFELMWGKDVVPGGGTGAETCAAGCKQGEEGTAEGELDGVNGIATDGNVVFVSEVDNQRISRFDATTGAFQLMAGRDVDPAGGMGAETCAVGCKRGNAGSGAGEVHSPVGLEANLATNHLWIADENNERVQRWSTGGMTYQAEFGTAGAGAGQFMRPRGLTELDGTVTVADTDLNRAQTFDALTGAFQASFGTPGPGTVLFPRGIGAGPGGLYVTDGLNRGLRFDPGGALLDRFGGPGGGAGQFDVPEGVGVAADGTVYVVDGGNDRIERFDSAGTFLGTWGTSGAGPGQFNSPVDVAVAADGSVYVTDFGNTRVQRFDPAGVFVAEWGSAGTGPGQFQSPRGIAVDPEGNVYVADAGNDRVQKFGADGTPLAIWGSAGTGDGQFDGPADVAADGAGNVFVADAGNNRVQRFSSSGEFREKIGANGGDGTFGDGPGEFRTPLSIAVDATGFVYVADSFNNRLQRLVGEPELTLLGKRRQRFKRFKVDVDCVTGPCQVALSGKVKTTAPPANRRAAKVRKPKIRLKPVQVALASGAEQRVKLKLRRAKRSRRILKGVLSGGGRAKLTVRATATNEAGAAQAQRKIKLKRG